MNLIKNKKNITSCLSNIQTNMQSNLMMQSSFLDNCNIFDIYESINIQTRIKVYQDSYLIRLQQSLAKNFPALYSFIGHNDFYKLAKKYINVNPSKHYSIRWFGHDLPDFLKNYYNKADHYLADSLHRT